MARARNSIISDGGSVPEGEQSSTENLERYWWNHSRSITFYMSMKPVLRSQKSCLRAEKLKREAANCLSLAVKEPTSGFAADLIAEAAMLLRRVRELSSA